MELAFALQENPCRWFPRKVAVLRFCFYSPSTSKMSGVGTQPAVLIGSPTRAFG
jgi:hypothetical protein